MLVQIKDKTYILWMDAWLFPTIFYKKNYK